MSLPLGHAHSAIIKLSCGIEEKTNASPEAKSIEAANNKVTSSIADDMAWSITTSGDDGKTLTIVNGTKYLNASSNSSNTGLRVNTTNHTWTLEVNGEGFAIKDNTTNISTKGQAHGLTF